jgi:phage terminase large subunit-like protein
MELKLPEGYESWPIEKKKAFNRSLKYNWDFWARPTQKLPDLDLPWEIWMILSGRGWGKTRTGAEAIKKLMTENPNCRIGIIGQTAGAVRDVCFEGESGLISVMPPEMLDQKKKIGKYNRSLGQLTLANGSMAFSFSGADPEKLRGFQSHFLWMDELCAFQYAQETWDMARFGLRLGRHPRVIITTTPKPSPLIIELVRRGREEPDNVILTTGSTFDNAANLPEPMLLDLRKRYEGTTLGRQELYAELILDDPGALWKRDLIEETRISPHEFDLRKMAKIVVAIDPSMSAVTERDSETGMIVAGLGENGHAYIIEDCSALRPSPDTWSRLAIEKYHQYAANRIVAEVNQGYDLVTNLLNTHDETVPVKKVYATRGGKFLRAEPVAALYEQKRVHHVGLHGKLEDQMTQWIPGKPSPDRLDAMVWAVTDLMLGGGIAEFFSPTTLPRLPGTLGRRSAGT